MGEAKRRSAAQANVIYHRPEDLTTQDANALCRAAEEAWRGTGPRTKRVRFKWRGQRYVSTLSLFAMHVDPDDGTWPRHTPDGMVQHLTGGYSLGPCR